MKQRTNVLKLGTAVEWTRQFYREHDDHGGSACCTYEVPPKRGIVVGYRQTYNYRQVGYGQSGKVPILGTSQHYYLCAFDVRRAPVKVPTNAITVLGPIDLGSTDVRAREFAEGER